MVVDFWYTHFNLSEMSCFLKNSPFHKKLPKKVKFNFKVVKNAIFSDLSPFYCIASLGASCEPVRAGKNPCESASWRVRVRLEAIPSLRSNGHLP